MTGPHRARDPGRTARLENDIMNLQDAGVPDEEIALRLEIKRDTVRRISGYMRESTNERRFATDMRVACQRHAAAIAATGRTYA